MGSKKTLKVVITTGDPDGIGCEVTAKALHALGPQPGVQFVCYRHLDSVKAKTKPLSAKFKFQLVSSLAQAEVQPFDSKTLIEVRSLRPAARWVEEAATACMAGHFQALVTAPLSKTSIIEAGLKDIGHTEILARISGVRDLFMGFWGEKFCVVLATGHLALAEALRQFNAEKLRLALEAAARLRSLLPAGKRKLPLALLGVNPHAGEGGLIGQEETWQTRLVQELAPKLGLVGPLVPDTAFLAKNWPLYSVYICPYHDQGLIPFKLVHGFEGGVHLTLGLPFVRTSVDHGTAKDLFGKNKAQSGSMKDALVAAIRLSKENVR